MIATRRYDAVVIGAGTAGLTAATRLAQDGASVCVLAFGAGSTTLAPATIDVLDDVDGIDPVDSPAAALPAFAARRPDHPYARLGIDTIAPALAWLAVQIPAPYAYVGSLQANHVLPSALGAPRRSALVPATMAAGALGDPAPMCVVGLPLLRDFHAALCADLLNAGGARARAVSVDVDTGRVADSALGLAWRFDDPGFRAAFAARLAPALAGGERVAMPAVLGLRDPHGAWSDLQERLERPVFEIPTLPPSAPGARLHAALAGALRAAGGGSVALGARVTGARRSGDRVDAVIAQVSGRERAYAADWFVLATGGFSAGGLTLDGDGTVRETALGLDVSGVPAPGEPRFDADYAAEQPLARAGVAMGDGLLARDCANVLVAGAALPGAAAWREGCGEGVAVTSGHAAAGLIAAAARTGAAA